MKEGEKKEVKKMTKKEMEGMIGMSSPFSLGGGSGLGRRRTRRKKVKEKTANVPVSSPRCDSGVVYLLLPRLRPFARPPETEHPDTPRRRVVAAESPRGRPPPDGAFPMPPAPPPPGRSPPPPPSARPPSSINIRLCIGFYSP